MVVMVYAYESVYCGLHGINTGGVFEVDNVAEADEIGKEMAYDLIDGYSHVFEDYDQEEVKEGIEWEVWPVRDNTGLSVRELDCEFTNLGRSLFVDEYDAYLAECGYNVWEVSEEEYEKYKEF